MRRSHLGPGADTGADMKQLLHAVQPGETAVSSLHHRPGSGPRVRSESGREDASCLPRRVVGDEEVLVSVDCPAADRIAVDLLVTDGPACAPAGPLDEHRDPARPELVRRERDVSARDVAETRADELGLGDLGNVEREIDLPYEPPLQLAGIAPRDVE